MALGLWMVARWYIWQETGKQFLCSEDASLKAKMKTGLAFVVLICCQGSCVHSLHLVIFFVSRVGFLTFEVVAV